MFLEGIFLGIKLDYFSVSFDSIGILEISDIQLRFRKFIKGILLKGSNLIKHTAAIAPHNPFSVYSYNYSELANKYGPNLDLCTNRIVNE